MSTVFVLLLISGCLIFFEMYFVAKIADCINVLPIGSVGSTGGEPGTWPAQNYIDRRHDKGVQLIS